MRYPAESPAGPEPLDTVLERLEAAMQRLNDARAPVQQIVADYELARRLATDAESRLQQAQASLHQGLRGMVDN